MKLLLSVFMLFLVGNIRLFLERLYIASELRKEKGGKAEGMCCMKFRLAAACWC